MTENSTDPLEKGRAAYRDRHPEHVDGQPGENAGTAAAGRAAYAAAGRAAYAARHGRKAAAA